MKKFLFSSIFFKFFVHITNSHLRHTYSFFKCFNTENKISKYPIWKSNNKNNFDVIKMYRSQAGLFFRIVYK